MRVPNLLVERINCQPSRWMNMTAKMSNIARLISIGIQATRKRKDSLFGARSRKDAANYSELCRRKGMENYLW